MKSILDKLALFVSILASPFFVIPIFTLAIIKYYSSSLGQFFSLALTFILFDTLLPFVFILYEVGKGKISDIHIAARQQRTRPFLVSILGTFLLVITFFELNAPEKLIGLTYVLLANGIIFAIITQYWKISIHSAALSGAITLLMLLINLNFAWLFLTVPLVAWARMRRHRHNIWQTLTAAFATLIITTIILKLIF